MLVTAFSLTSIASSESVLFLKGWEKTQTDEGLEYNSGNVRVIVANSTGLNGKSVSEYLEAIEKVVPAGAAFLSSEGVKPEKNIPGAYVASRQITVNGEAVNSILFACPGDASDEPASVLTFILNSAENSADLSDLEKFFTAGEFISAKCKDVQGGSSVSSKEPTAISQSTFSTESQIPGLTGFWYTGDIGFLNAVTFRNYLSFSDGQATWDVEGVMSKGRAQSQRLNPDKWSAFKVVENDRIQLIFKDGKEFTPTFSEKTKAVNKGKRYDGCWINKNVTPVGNSLTGGAFGVIATARSYCFNQAGQFKTDSSAAFGTIASGGGGAGSSGSQGQGRYRIDGQVITFKFNSGEVVRSSFGEYFESGALQLIIGQGRYVAN